MLGRSVRQPRPLDALDHDEEGAHREYARVAETGQGVLCGDRASIPHQHQRQEDLCVRCFHASRRSARARGGLQRYYRGHINYQLPHLSHVLSINFGFLRCAVLCCVCMGPFRWTPGPSTNRLNTPQSWPKLAWIESEREPRFFAQQLQSCTVLQQQL